MRRIDRATLGLIAGLALAAGLGLAFWPAGTALEEDASHYVSSGVNLLSGRGFVATDGRAETHYPPFYPILIGLGFRLTGDGETSARVISFLASVLLLIPLYALVSNVFSKRTAVMTVLLLAMFPLRVFYSHEAMSEALYTFILITASAWFLRLLQSQHPHPAGMAGVGTLIGLAYLTRPEGLLYLPVFLGFILLRRPGKRFLVQGAVVVLAFAALALPYVFYLKQTTGKWLVSGKGRTFYDARYFEEAGDRASWHGALSVVADERGSVRPVTKIGPDAYPPPTLDTWLKRVSRNAFRLLDELAKLYFPVGWALIGVGIFSASTDPSRRWRLLYLLSLSLPLGIVLVTFLERRYLLPTAFVFLALIAEGIVRIAERGERLWGPDRRSRVVVLAVSLMAVLFFREMTQPIRWQAIGPVERKAVGLWMRDHLPPGKVMAVNVTTAFYANMVLESFPYGGLRETLEYARGRGTRYVEIAERYRTIHHPEIVRLMDHPGSVQGMRLVHEDSRPGRPRVWLYVLDPSARAVTVRGERIRG
ncbi:MAG: glycosyltransferase family 39 protein [candidate division NC10 bacterium]|nr:glycosyltransferase family 39 protein [candidate division NC10 bacterium]